MGREEGSQQYLYMSISLVSCWAVKMLNIYYLLRKKLPGDLFEELVSLGAHLLGPPAILGLRARGEQLLVKKSPVFCLQVSLMR